ncbi:hypothetical protein TKK_0002512 [Trichogramma kaykai]
MVTMVSERCRLIGQRICARSSSHHRLESKESPDVERRDHPRIIELESKDVLGVERQDHPRIIGWRAKNLLTSSAEIILASSAREQGRSWRRAPGSSSHHRLESKDVPDDVLGVERRDRPRIIELESKDVPGVERRDRPRIIGSRAKNLLTSSAGIVLASSAREQGRSWRRAPGSSSHHRLESKDVPDVERRDHPRIIELESKDVPGVERRDRPRIIGSRAKNLLTSSAGIGLASSAREQRIS